MAYQLVSGGTCIKEQWITGPKEDYSQVDEWFMDGFKMTNSWLKYIFIWKYTKKGKGKKG